MSIKKSNVADIASATLFAVLAIILFFVNNPQPSNVGSKEVAKVLSVDNSQIQKMGLLLMGSQMLEVEVCSGKYVGEKLKAGNTLRAQMDLDKVFVVGDEIIVAIPAKFNPQKDIINAQDYNRTSKAVWLFILFSVLLVCFAGFTGAKALLSFVFAFMFIWKVVVPACLSGVNAILICFVAVAILTFSIIFLVGGFSRKAITAFGGAMLGISSSCIMAWIFTHWFNINGATMPFSQALLYSGHEYLKLSDLFIGGIFLSSSGAVMDLAMDVAAGQEEVYFHNPQITKTQLAISGWKIGKSVVGTMTTTLLLAYSGGYLTLIMAFTAEGVVASDFISNPYVVSEVVKTIIGSFGLVLVAPFTAILGGFIIAFKGK
ncbi:MAG: YibE/F family protein [Verrucomicrobiaceae bacterium]|nr:YibE/F family protein [Verrucomicrobiaceae bacterium]